MRFAKRIDQNHVEIVNELRKRGINVENLSDSGKGLTDIVTWYRGDTVFIELKRNTDRAAVKKTQLRFLSTWKGWCGIAKTVEDAVALATEPSVYALTSAQKDRLAAFYATMTAKEVALPTIEKVINGII